MRVVERELLESRGGDAGADVAHDRHEGGCGDGERSGKADVLVALAVADGRQRVDADVGGKFFEGFAEQQIVDERVGRKRQVMAVLLDGRGGQDEQRRVFRAALQPASS